MRISNFAQIAIPGSDLNAARAFYEGVLGAEFIATYDPPGLLFFNFNGVRLLIEKQATQAGPVIYFKVDDIDASTAELKAKGVALLQEPHVIFKDTEGVFGKAGESEWMAFFNDPAGNTLAFVSRK